MNKKATFLELMETNKMNKELEILKKDLKHLLKSKMMILYILTGLLVIVMECNIPKRGFMDFSLNEIITILLLGYGVYFKILLLMTSCDLFAHDYISASRKIVFTSQIPKYMIFFEKIVANILYSFILGVVYLVIEIAAKYKINSAISVRENAESILVFIVVDLVFAVTAIVLNILTKKYTISLIIQLVFFTGNLGILISKIGSQISNPFINKIVKNNIFSAVDICFSQQKFVSDLWKYILCYIIMAVFLGNILLNKKDVN